MCYLNLDHNIAVVYSKSVVPNLGRACPLGVRKKFLEVRQISITLRLLMENAIKIASKILLGDASVFFFCSGVRE